MKKRLFTYLQLMRFPNLFTAVADVLAGYLITRALRIDGTELLALVLSSACIYGAGCVLNDLSDREVDARERPSRPIPSGKVSIMEAFLLAALLFGCGLAAAFAAGWKSGSIALALVILVILYDGYTKEIKVWGPVNMAACRFLNLALGMAEGFSADALWVLFPFLSFVYVFSLTTLSKSEVEGGLAGNGPVVFGGLALVFVCLLSLIAGRLLRTEALLYLVILGAFVLPPLVAACLKPLPQRVGRAVKYLVLGIPLLDAVYVGGVQGWAYGLPVALCLVPSIGLSRFFYVT